MTKTRPDSAV